MYEDKHSAFLEAVINLRTEDEIAKRLRTSKISKPIKNSMGKMATHLMDTIIQYKEKNVKVTKGGAFFYSINSGNQGNHVVINGVKHTHSRFTIFNDALGLCNILEKGSGVEFEGKHKVKNVFGDEVNPLSSLVFKKDILPIFNNIYGDIFTEVVEEKEIKEERVQKMVKTATFNIARADLVSNLSEFLREFEPDLEFINGKIQEIEMYGVIHGEYGSLKEYIEVRDTIDAQVEIARHAILFTEVCSEEFVRKYNKFQINEGILKLMTQNQEFLSYLESVYTTDITTEASFTQTEDDIKHEYTFNLHVDRDSITTKISKFEGKIAELKVQLDKHHMAHTQEEIDTYKQSVDYLRGLVNGNHEKCMYHHGDCIKVPYTYVSKEDGCGRLVCGDSPQNIKKEARYGCLPFGHMYDINTSVFSIMRYLAVKIDPSIIDKIPHINVYIDHKDEVREELARRIFAGSKVPEYEWVKIIKGAMTGIGFGGDLKCTVSIMRGETVAHQSLGQAFKVDKFYDNKYLCEDFIKDEFVVGFHREYQKIVEIVCDYYEEREIIPGRKFSKTKETEMLAFVYQGYESLILRKVLDTMMINDGVCNETFNREKSVLPLHDGIYVNWKLDMFTMNKCISDVLGNEYPELLPTFEHTEIFNKEIEKTRGAINDVDVIRHKKTIAEQEREAIEWHKAGGSFGLNVQVMDGVADTTTMDKIVAIEEQRRYKNRLSDAMRGFYDGDSQYEDAGVDEDKLRW